MALIGTAFANKIKEIILLLRKNIMPFYILAEFLEKNGFEVTYLPVDETGVISIEDLKKVITR